MPVAKRKPGGKPLPRGAPGADLRVRPGAGRPGKMVSMGGAMNRNQALRGRPGPSRRASFSAAPANRARKQAKRGVRF